jgi:translation initiation factor 2 alpha subunit (eIF-2alpha)
MVSSLWVFFKRNLYRYVLGLIHISELSWNRISHPRDVVRVAGLHKFANALGPIA